MSGEKWTPGPWEIREYKSPYGNHEVSVEVVRGEMVIAKLGIETDIECAANKHLIAAAPELYASLKSALLLVDMSTSYLRQDIAEMGKNALKKARGEA